MDEYAKIASLLEEGRISPQEAEKLLAALDGPSPERKTAAAGGSLRVQIDRVDLRVGVDPALGEPKVEAPDSLRLSLQHRENGWELKQQGSKLRIGLFDLFSKRHAARLLLPAGVGLDVRLGQGALSVHDPLPALRASVGQGSVDFTAVEELDVQLAQGSISGRARLAGGSHRLSLGMGSVKLVLEKGSDLRLQLKTGMGEILVTGAVQHASKKPSARYEGSVGEGRGMLKVSVGMGSVEVEVL